MLQQLKENLDTCIGERRRMSASGNYPVADTLCMKLTERLYADCGRSLFPHGFVATAYDCFIGPDLANSVMIGCGSKALNVRHRDEDSFETTCWEIGHELTKLVEIITAKGFGMIPYVLVDGSVILDRVSHEPHISFVTRYGVAALDDLERLRACSNN